MVPPPKAGVGQPRILSPLDGRVGAVCLAWYLCPCVQACVQGLELLLLVLALLSGLLGVGWEVQRAEQEQGWDSERAAGVEKYWAVPAVCRVPLATRALLKWVPPHPRRGWGSSPASCNSAQCCAPERGVLAANPGAGARYPLRAAKRGIQQVLPVPPPSNVCTKAEPGLGVGGGSSSSLSSPLPCLPRAADFHLWELCKGSR